MKAVVFSSLLIFFVLGVLAAPFIAFTFTAILALFAIFFILTLSFIPHRFLWLGVALIGCFFLGVLRFQEQSKDFEIKKAALGREISAVGQVRDLPEETPKTTKVVFYLPKYDINIYAYLKPFSKIEYGEIYKIKGSLALPGEEIKDYYDAKRVAGNVFYPDVEKRGSDNSLPTYLMKNLLFLRSEFERKINSAIPEPEGALASGLLLGVKKNIPEWFRTDLSATGTSHIIALSGFNITIIIESLRVLCSRRSARLSFWLPVAGILFFIIMTGASASVVRAGIMGALLLVARKIGRQSSSATAIILAASVMIFLNPAILKNDLGFQLSFMAVIGLIYISPYFVKVLPIKNETIREMLAITLGAQVMSAPLLLYNFGTFSIVSPLANLVVVPLIPLAMLLAFLAGLANSIMAALGYLFSWPAYLLLNFIVRTIHFFGSFSFSAINNISFPPEAMGIIYSAIFLFIFIEKIMIKRRRINAIK